MPSFDFQLFCRSCDVLAELVEQKGRPDRALCPKCGLTMACDRAVEAATNHFQKAIEEAAQEESTDYLAYYRPSRGPAFVLK